MVSFRKSHYTAAILPCYIHRTVCTFHITDKHLIEILDIVKNLLKMLFSISRINYYRYLLCFIHRVQRYNFFRHKNIKNKKK